MNAEHFPLTLAEVKGTASVHPSNTLSPGQKITNVKWWEGGGAFAERQVILDSSKQLCKR